MVVYLSLENRSRSNVRNFLFHCFMEREFWTILTALEAGQKPQYIAHFHWRLRYEFRVKWKGGTPQQPLDQSSFEVVQEATRGPSQRRRLAGAARLTHSGERANVVGRRAEATTVTGNPPNRSDNKFRFFTVPNDCWTWSPRQNTPRRVTCYCPLATRSGKLVRRRWIAGTSPSGVPTLVL